MGSSFVTVDGQHGFWAVDSIHELWIWLVALNIDASREPPASPVVELRNSWLTAGMMSLGGVVYNQLDRFMAQPEAADAIRSATAKLRTKLIKAPDFIHVDAFNLAGFDTDWIDCIPREGLLAFAEAWTSLLDGKIGTTASHSYKLGFTSRRGDHLPD
ncbi:hypothetical protein [Sphingomonas sp. G-3-2-10]|uniref:hypothetical protein n=1 Tax=Sphingomonas sp. G-3-2-10 TaxID=2728838 RepID=UPI00146A0992|nr:hypothetical protein [Sphingomonas sp. G-3-2-10]NML04502.1 hypothetical protein [Sphingomonas sp. G-3-2-10]